MGAREKSQYQCMNCGTLHWIEDPPDIDEDELYTKMRCGHCKQMTSHLWVGNEPGEEYIYYDVVMDERFYK
jgi:DNA-directed RNA polymerase subunit RPC12/RpoP